MRNDVLMQKIYKYIGVKLDLVSTWIVTKADKWYTKSNLPKLSKEMIFLVFVLTGTLIGDLSDFFYNRSVKHLKEKD